MRNVLYPSLWQGCVGAWCPSVDRSRSTLLTDFSGYGNNGTLTNMEPATDWVARGNGMALDIDESNESVNCGNTMNVFSAGVTISLWAYRPAATSNLHYYNLLSTRRGSDNATPFSLDIDRTLETNGALRFYLNNSGFNIWKSTTTTFYPAASNPNTLIHVAVAYAQNSQPQFYIQGRFAGSTQTLGSTSPAILYTATQQSIGWFSNPGGDDKPFGGVLDDVRVYNRALTPSEIALLATRRGIAYETYRTPVVRGFSGGGGGPFTATGAFTVGGAEFSASAEFDQPTYTGSASLTTGGVELSASGTTDEPTFTASAALTVGNVEVAASGTFTKPTYTGSASLTVGGAEFASSGVTTNTFTASGSLVVGGIEFAASGSFTKPTYTASGAFTVGNAEVVASGTFATNTYTASASLIVGNAEMSASGTFTKPTYSGTATLICGGVEFAALSGDAASRAFYVYYTMMMGA